MGWSIRSEEPRQNHQKDMKMIITRVLYQEITSKSLLIFGYAMAPTQDSCLPMLFLFDFDEQNPYNFEIN